jgi:phosphopantetheine adenylyltransferase
MRSFKDIREARSNVCAFTFGRFNPPTIGHEKLLDALAKQAKKNVAPYYVFVSHSENQKKDPLPYTKKVAYMKKMFPKHARDIIVDKSRQVFEVAVSLYNKGHTSVIMVVGSDRVTEFDGLLKKYNKMEGRHGYYEFEDIQVISAGERDPDSEGVSGMSASKMRAAATSDDYDSFKNGVPKGFGQGMSLFKDVRKFMGVRESFVSRTESFTEEDVARDMYIRGEILNIGDVVTESYSGVSGKIIRRGTNYVTFAEEDGTPHKKWLYELDEMSTGQLIKQVISRTTKKKGYEKAAEVLKTVIDRKRKENDLSHDIVYYATQIAKSFAGIDGRTLARTYEKIHGVYEVVKQDKDIKDRKGSEPAKYYAKDADGDEMSVATKKKRAAHFAKSKDGPAPGDKDADTKPSKHTKKFKDMFGEEDPCWDTHKQVGMKKKGGKMVPNCVAKEDFQLDEKIEGLITKADKSGMPYGIL